jgi:hypothetical protein
MALGTSSPLFATWRNGRRSTFAKRSRAWRSRPARATRPPRTFRQNLFHIRAAVAAQISNPADAISVDVIGLLFDYIFRDPTIPESTRALFGRLQVPIVKAALLDRAFFADKKHPARMLLDHLAEAAVGAANDDTYRAEFEAIARKAIDQVCADFDIDVTVFREADRSLQAFSEQERQHSATALEGEVAEALHAEEDEADRAVVRALLRDRLAGLDIPFEVRSFIETIWADYLAGLRREHGVDSPPWNAALVTLDDMLWSIAAKERTSQKARLSKMIPSLIGGLRAGCRYLNVPAERSKAFFEALYELHMAAIKPAPPARAASRGLGPMKRIAPGSPCHAAAAGERPRLRRRDGRRHVGALRPRGRRDRRPSHMGQPAACEIHLHQPLALARIHPDAGRTCLAVGQRHGQAGSGTGAAVGLGRRRTFVLAAASGSRSAQEVMA